MTAAQLTVVVRVRPLNTAEKDKRHFQCVFPLDNQRLLLVDPEKYENNILRQNRTHERQFTFDGAFGPTSTQEDVHAATTGPMIDSVVAGYNATVFAYGATGAGKTYTMIGTKDRPGVMTLLTQSLYEKISSDDFQVQLSYLEIYNEVIRDLLNPTAGVLELMEDDKGNIRVPGLSTVRAPNLSRLMQILQEGNMRRTQEATEANKTSSRSHALLQVSLLRRNSPHAKLFMIDLAGSERASHTNNRGQRLKEGAAINRSLLALGNVINSLSSGNKGKYVNYRDSKLTRLLKDSLGGNARTCMIAHVTSASGHYEETYNTLVYASRAKNIITRPTLNRPASADQRYSDAMKEVRKEYERKTLPHAVSSVQIADKASTADRQPRGGMRWNSNTNAFNGNANTKTRTRNENNNYLPTGNNRDFSSLFNQLKEQYITLTDKQNKLRERLMKANQESYEIEMSRASKVAIITAWEKQHSEEKPAESIDRLKADIADLESKLSTLVEQRTKIEKALRKGQETSKSIETRLRTLSTSNEQKELIDLFVRMANMQAEKISAENDLAIQALLMQKTDSSMTRLQKYEMIADKLIEGTVEGKDREQLEQEYRIVKNQFHYHLIPLKQMHAVVSWNTLLLPKISNGPATTDDIGRVVANQNGKKRDSVQLPIISNGREKKRQDSDTTGSYDGGSEPSPESPHSLRLPPLS